MFRINNLFAVVLLPLLVIGSGNSLDFFQTYSEGDEPADAYTKLVTEAQAKTLAKQWKEAATLWERTTEINPTLARNWIQFANALYEAKEYRKAITAFEKWNELGASYAWDSTYSIACCYALLGEKQKALEWLEKALNLGYRDLKQAQTDPDFEAFRNDPKYRELVALVDTSKMSRNEGWRYDISHFAREIKRIHFDPYRNMSRAEFDAFIAKLNNEIPKLTDQQIIVRMMMLMQKLGDGHSSLRELPISKDKLLPVQFYLFKEGLFIITTATNENEDLLGSQVLRIGDKTVEQVMDALVPVISRDNKMWLKYISPIFMRNPVVLNGLGLIPSMEKVELTVRDIKGIMRTVTLTGNSGRPTPEWITVRSKTTTSEPLYLKKRTLNFWFEYLPESKTVFFQFNAVANSQEESLAVFCERLFKFINENDVERLVIDMRWNGGGNNFLNRPLVHGLISNQKINQRGKLFVIIGRNTFSAAMNGATEIGKHANPIFVGEPTGSSPNFVGETIRFDLPYSKITGSISDLYWQSSVAMDYRTWIAPELYAPPSFELFKANRDPAMEAITSYLQSK